MKKYKFITLFLVLGLLIIPFITKAYFFQNNLNIGSRGQDVTELQKYLISAGYLTNSSATGYFGNLTLTAVQKLQIANGFVSTSGAFGPKTRALLNNVITNPIYTTFPVGCTSNFGYSATTGLLCTSVITYPAGCSSNIGFSPTTGLACGEDSLQEVFSNQPGAIKFLTPELGIRWVLAVDLLTHNPNFIPGETPFFINQNTKIRNLIVTANTKTYNCEDTKPSLLVNTSNYINDLQSSIIRTKSELKYRVGGPIELATDYTTAYFDINGTNITAIYQQCLP